MYKEKIVDILTGEETERNYTAAEIDEVKKAQKQAQDETEKAQSLTAIRQSALAKLAALGLTEDEIAAL